jgi:predicted peptidase
MPHFTPYLTAFMLAFVVSVNAQERTRPATAESSKRMSKQVGDQQLNYLLQEPSTTPPKDGWPVLLFLHGYGECGDDLPKVKKHGPPKLIQQFDELNHCIVISPQCPRDSWWRTETIKALVDEVIQGRNDIDKDRLYVTGLSMGGYGIWSFISNYPDYFAAAMPICGGGNPFKLPANRPGRKRGITNEFSPAGLRKATSLPIWTFHGSHDNSVPVVETEDLVKSLREAGNQNCKFTIYPGAGHVAAWEMAYSDPNTWKWLFAQ